MTNEKRQEMKDFKEKAIALEHKVKGKRVSLDSGVMITSTEMQKLDSYESPTNVLKEPVFCDAKNFTKLYSVNNNVGSITPETPVLAHNEDKNNVININDDSPHKKSLNMKPVDISLVESSCETLVLELKSTNNDSTVIDTLIHDKNDINDQFPDTESIHNCSENISLNENYCDTLIPKLESDHQFSVENSGVDNEYISTKNQVPRVRSNSYTLSSPSPVMVAFLNSQIQKQMIEPKSSEKNMNHIKESKSEPSGGYVAYGDEDKSLKTKSISLLSVPKSFINNNVINDLVNYGHSSIVSELTDNKIIHEQHQDEKESLTSIGTVFSNDESVAGSMKTVFYGDNYENNSAPSSITCKSTKHCCCRHSDDEFSSSSHNIHYKTPEELNLEAERLRLEKLDIEKRHQEELSNLLKKQREEQEQIAVKCYLISQSSSAMSLDNSECLEYFSKQSKSPSIQSGIVTNFNNSVFSETSITSNCSTKKNLMSSSPRQNPASPYLQQNFKFYNRMRGGSVLRWIKVPTEVENAAATVINACVRGYLTRRLLRTEKAQLLKKTILDSLKTALIMHMELKKQQPTESDLELHRRIINQVSVKTNYYLLYNVFNLIISKF